MKTDPGRLFRNSSLALALVAMALGFISFTFAPAGGLAANSMRLQSSLLCCFLLELSLIFALQGALGSWGGDGKVPPKPAGREPVFKVAALALALVGVLCMAVVTRAAPQGAQLRVIARTDPAKARELAAETSDTTKWALAVMNALLLMSILCLVLALDQRLRVAAAPGAGDPAEPEATAIKAPSEG